jgi:hypothetical protein
MQLPVMQPAFTVHSAGCLLGSHTCRVQSVDRDVALWGCMLLQPRPGHCLQRECIGCSDVEVGACWTQVSARQEEDATTLLPSLQAALANGEAARQFGEVSVQQALTNWSQQPGQHAVPDYRCE